MFYSRQWPQMTSVSVTLSDTTADGRQISRLDHIPNDLTPTPKPNPGWGVKLYSLMH